MADASTITATAAICYKRRFSGRLCGVITGYMGGERRPSVGGRWRIFRTVFYTGFKHASEKKCEKGGRHSIEYFYGIKYNEFLVSPKPTVCREAGGNVGSDCPFLHYF